MRYLKCIEMLNYALRILRHDSRQPVAVSKMAELLGCIKSVEAQCLEEQINDIQVKSTIMDLMSAIVTVKNQSTGMTNLTDVMKQTLISGVMVVKRFVASSAFRFYENNDFEVDEGTLPIFRDIVETYFEAGGKLSC